MSIIWQCVNVLVSCSNILVCWTKYYFWKTLCINKEMTLLPVVFFFEGIVLIISLFNLLTLKNVLEKNYKHKVQCYVKNLFAAKYLIDSDERIAILFCWRDSINTLTNSSAFYLKWLLLDLKTKKFLSSKYITLNLLPEGKKHSEHIIPLLSPSP